MKILIKQFYQFKGVINLRRS